MQRHHFADKGLYSQNYGFSSSHVWMWELDHKEGWALKNWCFGAGEDSWESLGHQGDQTSQSWRKLTLNIHWKDWCWSWSSSSLTTICEEPTHWKSPWCWERLRAGGEGGNRGWYGWMASLTQWTWVWANSRRYWMTGKPGVLQSMGSKKSDTIYWLNNNLNCLLKRNKNWCPHKTQYAIIADLSTNAPTTNDSMSSNWWWI